MQNIRNFTGKNSVSTSDIFNSYSANINEMTSARKLSGYAKYLNLY